MERVMLDANISAPSSVGERLMRRLNESEDKTRHFFSEGTSIPFGITLSSFLSDLKKEEVEEPARRRSVQLSS